MPSWSERALRDVRPAEAAEHELRYRAAAPLVERTPLWVDLGCGDGTAAAAALDRLPARVLLVDRSEAALAEAEKALGGAGIETLAADLATADGVAAVRGAVEGAPGAVITCFATIELLGDFEPLVTMLRDLAGGATTVLSAPNHAFARPPGGPPGPFVWGEGAFEELQRLLPAGAVLARQVAVGGSALVVEGGDDPPAPEQLGGPLDAPPVSLLAAFGPDAAALRPLTVAAAVDRRAERERERERDADAAVLEARVAQLETQAGAPRG